MKEYVESIIAIETLKLFLHFSKQLLLSYKGLHFAEDLSIYRYRSSISAIKNLFNI